MCIVNISEISEELYKELNYYPIRSRMVYVRAKGWRLLCKRNNWDTNCSGAFLPKTLIAYIKERTEYFELDKIHEFIGHGLFFEYHPDGKYVTKCERVGRKLEISYELRKYSEFFAIWCEQYFGNNYGLKNSFESRYPKENNDDLYGRLENLNKIRKKIGLFGLFAALGFPKYYDADKISILIKGYFPQSQLKETRLVALYGSQKPYADIDLFFVSNTLKDIDYGWLDIVTKTESEFEEHVMMFSVAVRDLLAKGEYVFGDMQYFIKCKTIWETQPITYEAIKYNIEKHRYFKNMASDLKYSQDIRESASKYSKTYLQNALRLKQGKR